MGSSYQNMAVWVAIPLAQESAGGITPSHPRSFALGLWRRMSASVSRTTGSAIWSQEKKEITTGPPGFSTRLASVTTLGASKYHQQWLAVMASKLAAAKGVCS